ncbi:Pumilio domain-containing protein C6G9.14 [Durusdinium trenchii]|uniref:Pumilio domain-containing protein C6G9.14 n=1 Tax=Durusdinium trenchii TaxID=1381693 RepID=A0ABP0SJP1_9DINO
MVAVGKSGFPELPTVSAMLDESTQTLSGISSQAQKLQQQMLQVQQENAARMQRQKAVFDRKQEQEEKNRAVVKENAVIAQNIMNMKKEKPNHSTFNVHITCFENEKLLKHAQTLQKGNSLRHGELNMLQDQLTAAQSFLKDSLTQTDDSNASDLEVLKDEKHPSGPSSAAAVSFLEVSEWAEPEAPAAAAAAPEQPESLLTMLGNEVKVMKKQGQDSEAKLKELFKTDFQAGVKRHKALLAQQKVLKETLEKMKSFHDRLDAADKHLQSTRTTMDTRLHDGGLFMQKLSELTMAKPEAAVQAPTARATERNQERFYAGCLHGT